MELRELSRGGQGYVRRMPKRLHRHLVVGVAIAFAACGRDSVPVTAPAPTAAPTPVQTTPFGLEGVVYDTVYRGVDQARIEVIDGSQAGAVVTSDVWGKFSFGDRKFAEAFTLQASKEGHVMASQRVTAPQKGDVAFAGFVLASPTPSANLSGNYILTLTADSACSSLPAEATTWSVAATVSQGFSETRYSVKVSAPTVLKGSDTFAANVFGTVARFNVWTDADNSDGIVEQLGPEAYLEVLGDSIVSVESFPSVAAFSGSFTYCPGPGAVNLFGHFVCGVTPITCESTNHRFTLARQ